MKIATIIPKLGGGGAERVAANMSFFWSDVYEHEFVLFQKLKKPYPHKGSVTYLNEGQRVGKVKKLFSLYRRFIKIRSEKRMYAVTISHLFVPNVLNALSGGSAKSVLVIHGPASLYQNKLEKLLAKWAYNKADYVISVSKYFEYYAKQQLNIPTHKIKTIYNPMDLDQIGRLKIEKLSSDEQEIFDKPVFINVGRISKQKGQWHAIKAFSEIQKHTPDAQLVFLGDGDASLKEKMKEYVRSYGIEDHVHFFGNVSNPYKYLSQSFALFYTSLWDALPTVIIEAMACGLPVISSDCDSGPREIMAPSTDFLYRTTVIEKTKYGMLCPPCKPSNLPFNSLSKEELLFAEAARELLNAPEDYAQVKNNGLERARDFDGEVVMKQYEVLMQKLIDEDA